MRITPLECWNRFGKSHQRHQWCFAGGSATRHHRHHDSPGPFSNNDLTTVDHFSQSSLQHSINLQMSSLTHPSLGFHGPFSTVANWLSHDMRWRVFVLKHDSTIVEDESDPFDVNVALTNMNDVVCLCYIYPGRHFVIPHIKTPHKPSQFPSGSTVFYWGMLISKTASTPEQYPGIMSDFALAMIIGSIQW